MTLFNLFGDKNKGFIIRRDTPLFTNDLEIEKFVNWVHEIERLKFMFPEKLSSYDIIIKKYKAKIQDLEDLQETIRAHVERKHYIISESAFRGYVNMGYIDERGNRTK